MMRDENDGRGFPHRDHTSLRSKKMSPGNEYLQLTADEYIEILRTEAAHGNEWAIAELKVRGLAGA